MGFTDGGTAQGNGAAASATRSEQILNLDVGSVVTGLIGDLNELRAGLISVKEADARARLAHEILRGIHLVVQTSKFLANQAAAVNALPKPAKTRRNGRSKTIDAEDVTT